MTSEQSSSLRLEQRDGRLPCRGLEFFGHWTSAGLVLTAGFLVTGAAMAQISGGAFRGEVRDATDSVVPRTVILIHSRDNGTEINAESNGEGLYISRTLIPGSYMLSAAKPG